MSLRIDDTLEAFVQKIITNKEIMDILKLPTINATDSEEVKTKSNAYSFIIINYCYL